MPSPKKIILLLTVKTCQNCSTVHKYPNDHIMVETTQRGPSKRRLLQRFHAPVPKDTPTEISHIAATSDYCQNCFPINEFQLRAETEDKTKKVPPLKTLNEAIEEAIETMLEETL